MSYVSYVFNLIFHAWIWLTSEPFRSILCEWQWLKLLSGTPPWQVSTVRKFHRVSLMGMKRWKTCELYNLYSFISRCPQFCPSLNDPSGYFGRYLQSIKLTWYYISLIIHITTSRLQSSKYLPFGHWFCGPLVKDFWSIAFGGPHQSFLVYSLMMMNQCIIIQCVISFIGPLTLSKGSYRFATIC